MIILKIDWEYPFLKVWKSWKSAFSKLTNSQYIRSLMETKKFPCQYHDMKKLIQCALKRNHSMEYLSWYIIEKVNKRLQNIGKNPNLVDVFKNTLNKRVTCKLISEYQRINAYELKTISNTPTCWRQIFNFFQTLRNGYSQSICRIIKN